jgi:hypothetical protein
MTIIFTIRIFDFHHQREMRGETKTQIAERNKDTLEATHIIFQ